MKEPLQIPVAFYNLLTLDTGITRTSRMSSKTTLPHEKDYQKKSLQTLAPELLQQTYVQKEPL